MCENLQIKNHSFLNCFETNFLIKHRLSIVITAGIFVYLAYWFVFLASPCFEGDDINILAGVIQLLRGVREPLLYRYQNQPLYYLVLEFLTKISGLPLTVISVGLSIASLIFVLLIVFSIARKMVSVRFATYLIIGCVLIPEIIISGVYPNSSILAMALFYLAVYILVRWKYSFFSVAIGSIITVLSLYVRNDIVLLLPALFLIMFLKKKPFFIIIAAITIILTGWAIFHLLHLDINAILESYRTHFIEFRTSLTKATKLLLLVTPISIMLLALLGVASNFLKHKWHILTLVAVIILPISLFYLRGFTTPRYLLYIYPVFVWLAVDGWVLLERLPSRFVSQLSCTAIVCLLILQFIISGITRSPEYWIFTHDQPRPKIGILFFPFDLKSFNDSQNDIMKLMISTGIGQDRVYWVGWTQRGFLNYTFSMKAKEIIWDSIGDVHEQVFILSDNSRVIVAERARETEKYLMDTLETFYNNRYINILCIHGDSPSINDIKSRFSDFSLKPLAHEKILIVIPPFIGDEFGNK